MHVTQLSILKRPHMENLEMECMVVLQRLLNTILWFHCSSLSDILHIYLYTESSTVSYL